MMNEEQGNTQGGWLQHPAAVEPSAKLPLTDAHAQKILAEIAALLGVPEGAVAERVMRVCGPREYFSIAELADRWRCSRGTVYNRLRAVGAKTLDFAARGEKAVSVKTVLHMHTRRHQLDPSSRPSRTLLGRGPCQPLAQRLQV